MHSKKWIYIFFVLACFILVGTILINYKIDSYRIFHNNYSNLYREPNQNYIKMNFLLQHKDRFHSFIFGSSRVGKLNPKHITNDTYYNMTYSEGLPLEHLANIKLLLKSGVKIQNLLIGLDDFSYKIDPHTHLIQPMRLPHYKTKINDMSAFQFYMYYLLRKPSSRDIAKYSSHSHKKTYDFDIYHTGVPIVPKAVDEAIESDVEKYIHDEKFLIPRHYVGDRMVQTLKEIKEIIDISHKYNIKCIFFINPIHKTSYLDMNLENFQNFKYQLSKLTNFYDFSGLNSITTNNYYFYETSHYRTLVGDMILDRIFHTPAKLPDNFGIFVTEDSIKTHLDNLKFKAKMYKLQ